MGIILLTEMKLESFSIGMQENNLKHWKL